MVHRNLFKSTAIKDILTALIYICSCKIQRGQSFFAPFLCLKRLWHQLEMVLRRRGKRVVCRMGGRWRFQIILKFREYIQL